MINNPKIIDKIIKNIKNTTKEELDKAIKLIERDDNDDGLGNNTL